MLTWFQHVNMVAYLHKKGLMLERSGDLALWASLTALETISQLRCPLSKKDRVRLRSRPFVTVMTKYGDASCDLRSSTTPKLSSFTSLPDPAIVEDSTYRQRFPVTAQGHEDTPAWLIHRANAPTQTGNCELEADGRTVSVRCPRDPTGRQQPLARPAVP